MVGLAGEVGVMCGLTGQVPPTVDDITAGGRLAVIGLRCDGADLALEHLGLLGSLNSRYIGSGLFACMSLRRESGPFPASVRAWHPNAGPGGLNGPEIHSLLHLISSSNTYPGASFGAQKFDPNSVRNFAGATGAA